MSSGPGRAASADLDRVAGEIARGLEAGADEGRRDWWTAYLKGAARFRGVAMADVRAEVRSVWSEGVARWDPADAKALAVRLLHAECSEDKLAGVLLLAEHLQDELDASDLPMLATPLAGGAIADWNACDWYAVKALAPLCRRDGAAFARPLAAWSAEGPLWQRRAPAAALAALAGKPPAFPELGSIALEVCERLVADPQRFAQTAVGWLLRELSRQRPDVVVTFVQAREADMTAEARRMATARLRGRGRR